MELGTRILQVGEELPPLDPPAGGQPLRGSKGGKPKGKGAGERFHSINTFADFTLAGLNRAQIAVWLLLWRDTKPNGLAKTSQADLARRAGTDPRTIKRAIRRLQEAGLLVVVHRGGLRCGPSTYRVLSLAQCPKDRSRGPQ
jgi:hypothetical protein